MFRIKKGFTLIELLVVIAIIAILAAILFPVFAQAREKARQTGCLSNMKNIGTAIMLYTDDNHETFPMAVNTLPINGENKTVVWTHETQLFPYTKDGKVFFCPSSYSSYDKNNWYDATLYGNYTANPDVMGLNGFGGSAAPKKLARVKSPSNIVIVYEGSKWSMPISAWGCAGYDYNYLPGQGLSVAASEYAAWAAPDAQSDYNDGRHNEGLNLVYCDGHAGFEKAVEVYSWYVNYANGVKKNPFVPTTW